MNTPPAALQAPVPQARNRLADQLDRHWIALTLIAWVAVAIWYVWSDWNLVRWLSLGDTDDNMRLMQVRAWLGDSRGTTCATIG